MVTLSIKQQEVHVFTDPQLQHVRESVISLRLFCNEFAVLEKGYKRFTFKFSINIICCCAMFGSLLLNIILYAALQKEDTADPFLSHTLLMLLSLGRRYRSIWTCTSRFRDSFNRQVMKLLNCLRKNTEQYISAQSA